MTSMKEMHLEEECERLRTHIADGEARFNKEQEWFNRQIAEIQKIADIRVLEKDKEIESFKNQIKELQKTIDAQFDKSLQKVKEMQSVWHLQETLLKKRSDIEAEALNREAAFTRQKAAWIKQAEEMKNNTCEALKVVEQEYSRKRQMLEDETRQNAEELNRKENILKTRFDELRIHEEKFAREKAEITQKLVDVQNKLDEEAQKPKFNPAPGEIIPLVKESMEKSVFPDLIHALIGYSEYIIKDYIHKLPEKQHKDMLPLSSILSKGLDDAVKVLEPFTLSTQHVSLQRIIDETLVRFETELGAKKIEIKKQYKENIPRLYLDPKKVMDVFSAILQNAVESMVDGGVITISLVQEKDYVKAVFEDKGDGIPSKSIAKVSTPFYTTKPGSLGLGLYRAKSILTVLHARLVVESPARSGAVISCVFTITDEAV